MPRPQMITNPRMTAQAVRHLPTSTLPCPRRARALGRAELLSGEHVSPAPQTALQEDALPKRSPVRSWVRASPGRQCAGCHSLQTRRTTGQSTWQERWALAASVVGPGEESLSTPSSGLQQRTISGTQQLSAGDPQMASCSGAGRQQEATSVLWGHSIVSIRDTGAGTSQWPEQLPAGLRGPLQPPAGHHEASWTRSMSACPSGCSLKQVAILQGDCGWPAWLFGRVRCSLGLPAPVPKAGMSPPA